MDIDDFVIVDKTINLYQSTNGNYSELWFIIFNTYKTEIDFIVKFRQDAIKIGSNTIPVIVSFLTYKLNYSLGRIVSTVYKIASEQSKRPILSDKQQSEDMVNI